MASLASRLKAFRLPRLGSRSLQSQGINLENAKPVYDCGKLAWWARWTYFLVITDLVVTAAFCELSLNHWTTWEELPKDTSDPISSGEQPGNTTEPVGHYVKRPLWQRGLFTATNFAGGVGVAAVLLGGRSRIVRRMFIIPAAAAGASGKSVSERFLVIQSPLHIRAQGVVTPIRRARLLHGANKTEMMIGIKGRRGHYSVGLQGAEVEGQKLSPLDAMKRLYTIWYGERKGIQMMLDSAKVQDENP